MFCYKRSLGQSEDAKNKPRLGKHVTFREATYLTFADHVHGFKASQRAFRSPVRAKSHTRIDQAFDEMMILLHDVEGIGGMHLAALSR